MHWSTIVWKEAIGMWKEKAPFAGFELAGFETAGFGAAGFEPAGFKTLATFTAKEKATLVFFAAAFYTLEFIFG
ncbi:MULTISPECIES: hypothetical protein [Moorena]|uniref:hypothetical protein n=1 Tax=Moorena TaxID=1155738 RepID=UPI0025E2AE62|nr:hypothetical protein [Moorena sp. SIO4G3]